MKPLAWVRRHPLTSYFVLAYGISWGGILILLGTRGFGLGALPPIDTGLMFAMMLLGPSASGLTLTALLDGRGGLHRLWSNLTRWRVGLRWYAIASLTTPMLLLGILGPLGAVVAPAFAPRFQWPLFSRSGSSPAVSRRSAGRALRRRHCWHEFPC